MSAKDSSNTHEVISELFRAMNTKIERHRDDAAADLPRWADVFPYVNGGLFSGSMDVPRFSKIARSYLLHIGSLDWTKINPDIFGSMIQAVAEDEERGALGMHYTSVPNILKVLNPLFLDDLRAQAGGSGRQSPHAAEPAQAHGEDQGLRPGLRLRQLPGHRLQGDAGDRGRDQPAARRTGPALRDPADQLSRASSCATFPAEIARLALIIAEYQCDVLYRGQKERWPSFCRSTPRTGSPAATRSARLAEHLPADRHGREAAGG